MLHTKTKTVSIVCNSSNKTPDGRYIIPMTALAGESVKGASLKSAVYRNLFYNVVADGALKNNTFYFDLDGVIKQFDVPEGSYGISQLMPLILTGIQTILNLTTPTQTAALTYSSLTGKVTLTITDNGSGVIFKLMGGSFPDSINLLLGNTDDVTIDALTPTPKTFEHIIDLGGNDVAQLIFEEMAKGSGLCNDNTDSFGRTVSMIKLLSYRGAGFGELACYENQDILGSMLLYESGQNMSNMNIWLQTSGGTILDQGVSDMHLEILFLLA
jgi:hypothetical protein